MKHTISAVLLLQLSGCSLFAPPMVSIRYEFDQHGVAVPFIDDKPVPMCEDQRRKQVQALVNTYCPAGPARL